LAKALESLGVNWGKVLPIPNFDVTQWPEVARLMEYGIHLKQHHFRLERSRR
jgi:Mn-containing catalase